MLDRALVHLGVITREHGLPGVPYAYIYVYMVPHLVDEHDIEGGQVRLLLEPPQQHARRAHQQRVGWRLARIAAHRVAHGARAHDLAWLGLGLGSGLE